jgi:rRNA maturation protein Rpf1
MSYISEEQKVNKHIDILRIQGGIIMITHIVFFKLSEPSPENISGTVDKLLSMSGRIAGIRSIEVGKDVLRTERSYDIALTVRFDTLADLQAYQVDPLHAKEVVPHMKSVCSSIVAVDYES